MEGRFSMMIFWNDFETTSSSRTRFHVREEPSIRDTDSSSCIDHYRQIGQLTDD